MRLKIGINKLLSEGTSKYLKRDMEYVYGNLTFEQAQKILDEKGDMDILEETEDLIIHEKLPSIPKSKTFYLAKKEFIGWKRLYDLYPDESGVVCDYTIPAKKDREQHYIGNGKYAVYYKEPINGKAVKFKGVCENFNTNGLSAFWNAENEEMLLVEYRDIIGLYPVK